MVVPIAHCERHEKQVVQVIQLDAFHESSTKGRVWLECVKVRVRKRFR